MNSQYRPDMTPFDFIGTATRLCKEEILERVSMGSLPNTIRSLEDTAGFIDYNCLGGLCDDDLYGIFEQIFPFEYGNPKETLGSNAFTEAVNMVQSQVAKWMEDGGVSDALAEQADPTPATLSATVTLKVPQNLKGSFDCYIATAPDGDGVWGTAVFK